MAARRDFDEAVADFGAEAVREGMRGVCREEEEAFAVRRAVEQEERGGAGRGRLADAALAAEKKIARAGECGRGVRHVRRL